ncbi:peptidoglycan-binding domain-containing protein [Streptomyces zhihengii]|uniref:peptidoglycan-binding domain-containing protein n=1 Tax=Streptomyces zhihengii TaxID=1818004 RepID=UPI0036204651
MRITHTALAALAVLLLSAGAAAPAGAAGAAPERAAVTAACGELRSHPEIRRGDTGTAVRHAQCLLRHGAGYVNVEIDGIFGRITEIATEDAQSRCGAGVDGIIGPRTWECLHAFPG